jgi:hypothetical protein
MLWKAVKRFKVFRAETLTNTDNIAVAFLQLKRSRAQKGYFIRKWTLNTGCGGWKVGSNIMNLSEKFQERRAILGQHLKGCYKENESHKSREAVAQGDT